ncbi:CoA transferase [Nocardia jiangxiensis]|uniref:CoA transferase n=1 Tax=Nocardia jiangxiensis TaxID=282685 RepID=A0ABW6SEB9_9NOCA
MSTGGGYRDLSVPARPLRVVELAAGVAGQACGRLFAGLGHDVLKFEPPTGDPMRNQAPLNRAGIGFTFATLNSGKRSRVVELETSAGRSDLAGQLSGADVLIIDLGPRAAEAAGLSATQLRATWPHLTVVWFTLYGLDDSRSNQFGDSLLAESYGGLAWMIGEPSQAPLSLGGEQAAHASAFVGFFGAMLAIRRSGGDVVDVALCDVAAYLDWKSEVSYAVGGQLPKRSGASIGPWRIVPAADGWIGVVFQPEQWDSVVALIGDPALSDPELEDKDTRASNPQRWWPVITGWAAELPKREIYRRAQRLGLPFGYSADMADLSMDPQFRARGFITDREDNGEPMVGPLVVAAGQSWCGGEPPELGGDNSSPPVPRRAYSELPDLDIAPLAGVVVLDLGTITAGAATSRFLADYGATVIKVEAPDRPDMFRVWSASGPTTPGAQGPQVSPLFESNNAGKLAVSLDLKSEQGRVEMASLAAQADVLVENFTVGVTERLGIDHASLLKINPELISVSLSSQGQSGPEARSRSYGSTLDLLSGLASVTGYSGGAPIWSSADVNYPDQLVSLLAAGLAVHSLNFGLKGEQLDLSQREVVSWTMADRIAEYAETGRVPEPGANRRAGSTPHDVYRCAGSEDWVAIACHRDADRTALAAVLGARGWAEMSETWWQTHYEDIDRVIAEWSIERSREECVRQLVEAGVPCAPVNTAADRERDPRYRERRVFLNDGLPRKGFPMRLLGYQPPDPTPAPDIGRDNATVLVRRSMT